MEMSLMDLVQDNHVVTAETRVRRDLPQQETFSQEENFGLLSLLPLEPDLVADLLLVLAQGLEAHPLSQRDAGNPPWLGAGNVGEATVQQVLRDLGGLATARVPGHDHDLVISDGPQYLGLVVCYGQVRLTRSQLSELRKLLFLEEVDVSSEDGPEMFYFSLVQKVSSSFSVLLNG